MIRLGLLPELKLVHRSPVRSGTATFSSGLARRQTSLLSPYSWALTPCSLRSFTNTRPFRDDGHQPRDLASKGDARHAPGSSDSRRLKKIQKPGHVESNAKEAPRADLFLSEQTASNKEQRKADWAIIKEMSKYLWPKVCQG